MSVAMWVRSASACGVWTTAGTGVSERTVGKNSTITATGTVPYVGGVLGYVERSDISVNTNIGTTTAAQSSCTAVISGVNVLATGSNPMTIWRRRRGRTRPWRRYFYEQRAH